MGKAAALAVAVAVAAGAGAARPVAAEAAREVIREDTTWTKAESPIRVGTVRVEPGVTLTIEPGVEVVFEIPSRLVVAGALRAEGTAAEPIVFTSDTRWGGIRFVDAVDPRPPSVIRHVRVANAGIGIRMRGDAISVADSLFVDNDAAIEVLDPDSTVTFSGNELYSNRIAFVGRTTGTIEVVENDFWDNDISLLFLGQDPYSCPAGDGVFEVHHNDVLRGPATGWFANDVRTSPGSAETGLVVDASQNWWGSTYEEDIEARLAPERDDTPPFDTARIEWAPPAEAPQTPAEPPGAVRQPPEDHQPIGDVEYYMDLVRPDWGDCFLDRSLRRLVGIARPAIGEIPEEVETVALVRGVTRCKSYDPREGFVKRPCGDPIEFDVPLDGNRMTLELRRPLRTGRYTFHAGLFGRDVSRFRVLPF
ncbi:MAG TPA: hypothetical protein VHJ76_08070 [Actinomycetota bacterium]|nr:hypothetical protein [Actinomycetota bacterium]